MVHIICLSPEKSPRPQPLSNVCNNPTHFYMQMFVIFSTRPVPAQAYPVLCEAPWAQLSLLCKSSCAVLDPCGSLYPSSHSSTKLLELRSFCWAMGLCICFCQLLDETSQKAVMLGSSTREYAQARPRPLHRCSRCAA